MNPLFLIPSAWWRWVAIAVLGAALIGFGWVKGAASGQRKIDAMVMKATTEGIRITKARDVITTKIETKYLPQITQQGVITETIVKEVPVYVPSSAPDLPGGFRVLHDAAAAGRIPDSAGVADAAPVSAQSVASTIAANYGVCRADQMKLRGLQEWVIEQGRVK